ncbi:hypothetical protein BC567DRAFT_284594 [Phyllosticta citribraziliensis]
MVGFGCRTRGRAWVQRQGGREQSGRRCEEGKWADVTNEWSGLGLQSEDEPQGRQFKGEHMQRRRTNGGTQKGQLKARASKSARLPLHDVQKTPRVRAANVLLSMASTAVLTTTTRYDSPPSQPGAEPRPLPLPPAASYVVLRMLYGPASAGALVASIETVPSLASQSNQRNITQPKLQPYDGSRVREKF